MSRKSLALLLGAVLLVGAAIAYRTLGGGEDAAVPAVADAGPPSIESLKAAAEADPLNPGPWQELGFAYFETGQYDLSAKAYRQAIEGDKDNAVLWSSMGEALVNIDASILMPPRAVEAFEKALALDPSDARARYFLAVKKDLEDDHEGAIADWLALLEDTPPGALWESDLRQTIEQVGKINKINVADRIAKASAGRPAPAELTAGNAIPGPSQEQIAAASAMPPGEQRTMAEGMVESLAAKLRANPANPDGWVMLMRSRMTLGEPDKASQALKDAVAANPGDAERLRKEAAALGIR
ncbi:tetratricopeptide repeat protein [Altererythrobacter aquaemixtae]|uniref:Tetratricopeptide repeat protein n=2 Tax=Pontixanthobacter aquaemixtae TaxID=1958940 RepID=A0A844ZVF5_9SPHN|nr:tetratricopeptide repeat protein [Pontixanthobacter aquaemixtae]